MTISEKIQHYRKNAGLSQEDLARSLLVSRQTISLWENGQTIPTIDNLIRLREIFNVSLDDMLCEKNEKPVQISEEKFDESYRAVATRDELIDIRRRLLSSFLLFIAVATLLLSCTMGYWYLKSSKQLIFNFALLIICSLLITAITLTVLYLAIKLKKIKIAEQLQDHSTSIKINDSALIIEKSEKGVCVSTSGCSLENAKLFSVGNDHIEIIANGDFAYLNRVSIPDSSRMLSIKKSVSPIKRINIIAAIVAFTLVSIFTVDLFLSSPLARIERYSGVDIPKYTGISENKSIGLTNGIYVDYYAEIFISREAAESLNETIITDEDWHSASTDSFPEGILPEMISYQGAEYFSYREYTSNYYAAVFYFIDENMLRVVLCNKI